MAGSSGVVPVISTQCGNGSLAGRRFTAALVLIAGALAPVWVAGSSTPPPRTRDVHIEAYRYGFSPSRIHVNRGDRLRLSFSTRDTGQSFFLQDYDLHVVITPGTRMVELQRLSRPGEAPELMDSVEFVAGLPGWRGWFFQKSTFRNHTYNGPLHGTERGDLVVSPNLLLHGGLGLLCAIPLAGLILLGRRPAAPASSRVNLFTLFPWLRNTVRAPSFPFILVLPMLAVFWFIVLAGLLGTKVAGRNAAPMLIWVVWLSALIIALVPLGGRIWCIVCPLPVIGEWWQRARLSRNRVTVRVFGRLLRWPSWLSNAWPRVLLFLLLGTFSTNLVMLPAATSWMLIGLVATAVAASFFPDQRLFCRYLCPINSYISIYATAGRVMVRPVDQQTCQACDEQFCLTGSAKGWGCPYGLCAGELDRNNDCGACMECVKTCAKGNVSLFWRTTAHDSRIADFGEAWQAIVMFTLGCLYCLINLGPWDWIRDSIDLVDKGNWGTFLLYATLVWVMCLGILPAIWHLLTKAGMALAGLADNAQERFKATVAALIPAGLACWIAFALATFLSMWTFAGQSLSDPFNWGWNLLGMAGSAWHIPFSPGIPAMQVVCVLCGFVFAMGLLHRTWLQEQGTRREALMGAVPQGLFVWATSGGMIWFFAG